MNELEQSRVGVRGSPRFGVRPPGFRNGDAIHAINGIAVDTAESLGEAYIQLRTGSEVTVSLTRRGKAMTLRYELR